MQDLGFFWCDLGSFLKSFKRLRVRKEQKFFHIYNRDISYLITTIYKYSVILI